MGRETLAVTWPDMEAADAGAWADAADVMADAIEAARREWARTEGRRLRTNRDLADKLDRIGRADLAWRVAGCHAGGSLGITLDGRERVRTDTRCHVRRLCAWCARGEAARRARVLRAALLEAARRYRLQLATLTVSNAPVGELARRVDAVLAAWDRLRRRAVWRRVIRAAALNVETTWHGAEGCECGQAGTYHIHIHVIVARPWYDGTADTDLDWRALDAGWRELTGGNPVDWEDVDGRTAEERGAVAAELTKYVSKLTTERRAEARKPGACPAAGGGLLDMPDEAFREWVAVFGAPHRRWWRTFGEWYRLGARLEALEEEEAAEEPAGATAPEAEPPAEVVRLTWRPGDERPGVFILSNNSTGSWSPQEVVQALRRWVEAREARRAARRRRRERWMRRRRAEADSATAA